MRARGNDRQMRRAVEMSLVWCFWGRHDFIPLSHVKEQFPAGTMCLECQLAIVDNVSLVVDMPQMSVAMYRQERLKREKRKREMSFDAEMKRDNPETTGIVYYMRINDQIKIGYTTNLTQRSRAYPPGTELLAVEPATPYTERDRHQQFHRYLVRGREWFSESDELMAHISELEGMYDVPRDMMHQFTTRKGT